MISIPNNRRRPALRTAPHWSAIRGVWTKRGLGSIDTSWCDTASAWNPLSYVFCLPSDVKRVTAAATATFPAPPAAAPPGAPQTFEQMTVPGAYAPIDSAVDSHDNSIATWTDFYSTVAEDNGTAPAPAASGGVPLWVWIAGAGVAFLWLRRGRR